MRKQLFTLAGMAALLTAFTASIASAQEKAPQFGKDPIPVIVKKMTLEEKVKVVVGKGFSMPGLNMSANDTTPDKLNTISGHTIAIRKYGIPSIGMADGPAGMHRFVMTARASA